MTLRVLVPQRIAPEGLALLEAAGHVVVEPSGTDIPTLRKYISTCQAVLTRTLPLPREVLEAAPDLKVISRHGVGVDHIDLGYCREQNITVTNAPEANIVAVAEHALTLLLVLTKNLIACDTELRRGNFEARNSLYGIEVANKTLGVVGLGKIGQAVAVRAAIGLGMNIVGFDPYVDTTNLDPAITPVSLEVLLATADVVTVHVPLTPATRRLFDATRFDSMKQGSYFINCSRGEVVDEKALENALLSGRLRGAGLDVFEQEPLPVGHPLTRLPNVLLTPHMAAHNNESMIRMAVHAAQGIIAVAEGREPQWPVGLPNDQPTAKG
ncbi:NAD(P)-dependent oxidoreductase [Arthrobacter sp.]|uniref:hydroxyacid dehydrogenase n=1 Tax=Arthrobacter sp. TaxID=1667 RepID=UPI003399C4E6